MAPLGVTDVTKLTGTEIKFKPSKDIFSQINFKTEFLIKRLRELSFLNEGVCITLLDDYILS